MNTMLEFLIEHKVLLLEKLWEQFYLAGLAIGLASLVGIPLGLWVARRPTLQKIILGVASIFQTIPSLALLVFLLPFLGIGFKPAIITLSVYAILPIIQNTVSGLRNIPKDILEAAKSLGFTPKQTLWIVELPLALPLMLAGLRIATAMSIGIATLAAFIGAGGLGDFIYEGLVINNNRLILLGAIPAALLALTLDALIGRVEIYIKQRHYKHLSQHKIKYISFFVIIFVLAFSFLFFYVQKDTRDVIRIGSKNSTEQFILGELMAQIIEKNTDLNVIRKFNLGNTTVCQRALLEGDIDLYAEYTGIAKLVVLRDETFPAPPAKILYENVKAAYQKRYHLIWLPPFGFNNNQALVVRKQFQQDRSVYSISDLLPIDQSLTIGFPPEGIKRPDALPALEKYYHLKFKKIKILQSGITYLALNDKQIDVIIASTTDAQILKYPFVSLQDDKHIFPSYLAAPVVREAVLKKYPKLLIALKKLKNSLDEKTMRDLNYQVDIKHRAVSAVVRDFLTVHTHLSSAIPVKAGIQLKARLPRCANALLVMTQLWRS